MSKVYPDLPEIINTKEKYTAFIDKYATFKWEEEKPKEWIVTKIKGQTSGKVYTMNEKNIWVDCNNNGFFHDFHRNGSKGLDCDIVEVKRLSDGKVFTISNLSNFGKITGFAIENGEMWAAIEGCKDKAYLNDLAHKKEQPVDTDAFVWNRLWAMEFALNPDKYGVNIMDAAKAFEQSKSTPKEDKIEVTRFIVGTCNVEETEFTYLFLTNKEILFDKYEAIKKAIEFVVNSGYNDLVVTPQDVINKLYSQKTYTEKELLEAESKAFHAALARDTSVPAPMGSVYYAKYPTFQDYIKTKNNN